MQTRAENTSDEIIGRTHFTTITIIIIIFNPW